MPKQDKDLKKFYDFINKQNFESAEDLQKFLDQTIGKRLDEIVPKNQKVSVKEQATDLVYDAYEESPAKAKKLIDKALKLDPENVDAFVYLGYNEPNPEKSKEYFYKAMSFAEKEFGNDFEDMKGHFWGLHQTRPYMNAKAGYADVLVFLREYEEATKQFSEMIELNPNDNQGIRYKLGPLLVSLGRFKDYEALRKLFKDDKSAQALFTYAVYLFRKDGSSPKASQALKVAHKANKFFIPEFFNDSEKLVIPEYYSPGSKEEAIIYLMDSKVLWQNHPELVVWLSSQYNKLK